MTDTLTNHRLGLRQGPRFGRPPLGAPKLEGNCTRCRHPAHFYVCDAKLGWWRRFWQQRRSCACVYREWFPGG
jgi:hypothetical protein